MLTCLKITSRLKPLQMTEVTVHVERSRVLANFRSQNRYMGNLSPATVPPTIPK